MPSGQFHVTVALPFVEAGFKPGMKKAGEARRSPFKEMHYSVFHKLCCAINQALATIR